MPETAGLFFLFLPVLFSTFWLYPKRFYESVQVATIGVPLGNLTDGLVPGSSDYWSSGEAVSLTWEGTIDTLHAEIAQQGDGALCFGTPKFVDGVYDGWPQSMVVSGPTEPGAWTQFTGSHSGRPKLKAHFVVPDCGDAILRVRCHVGMPAKVPLAGSATFTIASMTVDSVEHEVVVVPKKHAGSMELWTRFLKTFRFLTLALGLVPVLAGTCAVLGIKWASMHSD